MHIQSVRRRHVGDYVMAFAAVGALTLSVVDRASLKNTPAAVSDFKTLYASAWCLVHGQDAYTFGNLRDTFLKLGVTPPHSWYGHAPVYPPSTLAALAPLTLLRLDHAAYLLTFLSAMLFAFGLVALLRLASETFDLGTGSKALMIGVCVASPLLSFAFGMGNPSVLASALCILAFTRRRCASVWLNAAALAAAIVLKPHLALWFVPCMLLLPERRARAVALRATGLVGMFAAAVAAFLACSGTLVLQIRAYAAILRLETAPGSSMDFASREALPIAAQITSLRSLLGFWTLQPWALDFLCVTVLVALAAVLLRQTRLARTELTALLAVGAWSSFGLLATYHRAHDATVLLILAPCLLFKLRSEPQAWQPWVAIALYFALSIGPAAATVADRLQSAPAHSLSSFLLLRQAGLANLALCIVLLLTLGHQHAFAAGKGASFRQASPLRTLSPQASASLTLSRDGALVPAGRVSPGSNLL